MAVIDIAKIDLNLLVVLDALLRERSVTAAARRLGLTQSTVSHSLGRLRELFGDPLLLRAGRRMTATPRAGALEEALRRTLADVRRLLEHEGEFEPARSRRTFTLVCPDLLVAVLPDLLARQAREAPLSQLVALSPATTSVRPALELGSVDVAVGPVLEDGPGLRQQAVGQVRWCVLARRGHPAIRRGRLDRAAWLAGVHTVVGSATGPGGVVGQAIERLGVERRVGFYAPSFLVAQVAVARTDLLLTAPRELVADLAGALDLVTLDLPLPLPPVRVALQWHERLHNEAWHRWLRELLRDVLRAKLAAR